MTEPQAKGVANAIKLVNPHFRPTVDESQRQINYPSLVQSWYSDRNNSDIKLKSAPGRLERELNETRLHELFEEQISRELSGFTSILSIEDNNEDNKENEKLKEMFLECRNKWKEALVESFEKEMFKTQNTKGTVYIQKLCMCIPVIV